VEELIEAIVPALEVDAIAGPSNEQRVFVATRAPEEPAQNLSEKAEEGKALVLFTNGDKYIGGVSNGKKNGDGMYVYADGSAYKGTWEDDAMNGSAHPMPKESEKTPPSEQLARLHELNERNVQGVAALKMRSGGGRNSGPTLLKLSE